MKMFLGIVIILFAGLHAFAAIAHAKNSTDKTNDILMTLGAIITIISGALCVMNVTIDWILALCGLGFIVFAAIQNGKQKGNFHIKHHIVRISISIVLVVGLFVF